MKKLHVNQEKKCGEISGSELELGVPISDQLFGNKEYCEYDIRLSERNMGYLRDHIVFGNIVVPFAFYLDLICVGARKKLHAKNVDLKKVRVLSALNIDSNMRILRVVYTKTADHTYMIEIISKVIHSSVDWVKHIQAELSLATEIDSDFALFGNALEEDMHEYDVKRLYEEFSAGNINYGSRFQVVKCVENNGFLAKGLLGLSDNSEGPMLQHSIHPTILDGGFQLLGSIKPKTAKENDCYIPVSVGSFSFRSSCDKEVECFALVHKPKRSNRIIKADLLYLDNVDSTVFAMVKGLTLYKSTDQTFATSDSKLTEKGENIQKIA